MQTSVRLIIWFLEFSFINIVILALLNNPQSRSSQVFGAFSYIAINIPYPILLKNWLGVFFSFLAPWSGSKPLGPLSYPQPYPAGLLEPLLSLKQPKRSLMSNKTFKMKILPSRIFSCPELFTKRVFDTNVYGALFVKPTSFLHYPLDFC